MRNSVPEKELSSQSRSSVAPLFVLGILVSSFAILRLLFRRHVRQTSPQAIHPHQRSTEEIDPVPDIVTTNIPPSPTQQPNAQWRKDDTPDWKKFTEIGVAIGTLGLLVINVFLWIATRDNAEAAKRAAVSSSRAWVAPLGVVLESQLVENKPVTIKISAQNVGKEPALDVHPIYRIKKIEAKQFSADAYNDVVEADDICKGIGPAKGAAVFYPDAGTNELHVSIVPEWIDKTLITGDSGIFVEVCYAYQTVGETHHTAFCYFHRAGVSTDQGFNLCMAGNHAD